MTQGEFIKNYIKVIGEGKKNRQGQREIKAMLIALEKALVEDPEHKITFRDFGTFTLRQSRGKNKIFFKECTGLKERINTDSYNNV